MDFNTIFHIPVAYDIFTTESNAKVISEIADRYEADLKHQITYFSTDNSDDDLWKMSMQNSITGFHHSILKLRELLLENKLIIEEQVDSVATKWKWKLHDHRESPPTDDERHTLVANRLKSAEQTNPAAEVASEFWKRLRALSEHRISICEMDCAGIDGICESGKSCTHPTSLMDLVGLPSRPEDRRHEVWDSQDWKSVWLGWTKIHADVRAPEAA